MVFFHSYAATLQKASFGKFNIHTYVIAKFEKSKERLREVKDKRQLFKLNYNLITKAPFILIYYYNFFLQYLNVSPQAVLRHKNFTSEYSKKYHS